MRGLAKRFLLYCSVAPTVVDVEAEWTFQICREHHRRSPFDLTRVYHYSGNHHVHFLLSELASVSNGLARCVGDGFRVTLEKFKSVFCNTALAKVPIPYCVEDRQHTSKYSLMLNERVVYTTTKRKFWWSFSSPLLMTAHWFFIQDSFLPIGL